MSAHGLIAAGSPHTARAGAEIFAAGGNAIDAIVAAALATPIAEPGLSSMGGGGILQFLAAGEPVPTLCDFFANGPGLDANGEEGRDLADRDFTHADLDFGPTTQRFFLGRASAVGHPPLENINVMGGSVAIGHPFAATGGRVTMTLLNEMKRRDVELGIVTVCAAGGMGFAMVLERV